MGLIRPVSEEAREMGFSLEAMFPRIKDIIMRDGVQYGFPANITADMMVVNRDCFREVGMETPPERMDFAQFERIGKEYCRRANEGLPRPVYFYSTVPERFSTAAGGSPPT